MSKKKTTILMRTLQRGLSVMRPNATHATVDFTQWLCANLPPMCKEYISVDGAGNLHIDCRRADSKTLFIAHVDTVHRTTGVNKIRKTPTHWHAEGAPLGADDGAGCAMLMHMMHNGVPGYYIFSQGEECGGIGAKHLATKQRALLKQFDRAIAFDRRGIDSVISHQGYGRCASDTFCQALSNALCDANDTLMYLPDDTGVYTDTAEFVDDIPECTNVSVGYAHEHSDKEVLNIVHFEALAKAVLGVDWDGLPTERDPTKVEYKQYAYAGKDWWKTCDSKYSSKSMAWYDDDEYFEHERLQDALYDARAGLYEDLLEYIAEEVYPEDPEMALKFLDKRRLTDDLIEEALQNARTYDAPTVLCTLFDAIHCEA